MKIRQVCTERDWQLLTILEGYVKIKYSEYLFQLRIQKSAGKYIEKRKVIIIHDEYFSLKLYKNNYFYKFLESIKENCSNVHLISIPGGDKTKDINHLNKIIEKTLSFEIDRDSIIIAFGGGVVGDIAGFVSSIVLRGINYIQVPTTLLSQVDSSIGGKTGINSKMGKNLIGAFHQPLAVISDINILNSLPKRPLRQPVKISTV